MKIVGLLLFLLLREARLMKYEKTYNYYEFAVQKWCSDDYKIHGLWPQIDADNYPTYCEPVDYTEPSGELLDDMIVNWKECNNDLWEHEWEKHGSCIKQQNNISENDFFNLTLELFDVIKDKTNLNEICREKNCIVGCFDLNYEYIKCP